MKHEYVYQDLSEVEIDRILVELYEDIDRGFFDGMELDDFFWYLRRNTILEMQYEQRKKKKKRIRYNHSYSG